MNAYKIASPLFALAATVLLTYFALGIADELGGRLSASGLHSVFMWIMLAIYSLHAGAQLKSQQCTIWAVIIGMFGVLVGTVGIVFARIGNAPLSLSIAVAALSGMTVIVCGYADNTRKQEAG